MFTTSYNYFNDSSRATSQKNEEKAMFEPFHFGANAYPKRSFYLSFPGVSTVVNNNFDGVCTSWMVDYVVA